MANMVFINFSLIFLTRVRNIVGTCLLAVFFFFLAAPLYSLGKSEDVNPPNYIDPVEALQNEPIIQKLLIRNRDKKPSLAYLRLLSDAKNAIEVKDYYEALNIYTEMFETYGAVSEIVFGLGESYFLQGDQRNSMLYYLMLLSTDKDNEGKDFYIMSSDEAILASYRVAFIYYQQGNMNEYENTLLKIVNSSRKLDFSLMYLIKTQSLDYVINLSQIPLDYSYIARREIGVMYAFRQEDILDARTKAIQKKFTKEDIRGQHISLLNDDLERETLEQLFAALGMATRAFTDYIQEEVIGYNYTDLSYMIEILNRSAKGKALMKSFDIERILVAIRKYYISESVGNTRNKFIVLYCTELLEKLSFFEDESSVSIYQYYSNLN